MRVEPKKRPEPPPPWKPAGLSDKQLQLALDAAAKVELKFRKRFFLAFMDRLSRSLLLKGGNEPTNDQVRDACRWALSGFPPNSTSSSPPVEAVGASPSMDAATPGERVGGLQPGASQHG